LQPIHGRRPRREAIGEAALDGEIHLLRDEPVGRLLRDVRVPARVPRVPGGRDAAQLAWAVAIALTFLLFIPIEERQLLRARGEEYQAYMTVTRYRVFRGIW
jgi:hypothetical protein